MLIGRENELKLLKNIYNDNKSHFISIYGRRRIGKTYLINEAFKNNMLFHHSGVANGTLKTELFAFTSSLKNSNYIPKEKITDWFIAFEELKELIKSSQEKRKIIFIDELSWMDTPKSNLIQALENFWNGWASFRDDIILIVCASATSWMLKKVIHNKGGLYNRLTEQIHLKQFTLKECKEFLESKQISTNEIQVLKYYMVLGGVPYYYNFIEKGLSVEANIDNMIFKEDAPLKEEFKYLFPSIFKNPTVYLKIISALAKKKIGLTRDEIIENAKLINSGDLSTKLEELESCGFIRKYNSFGMKSKSAMYQIIDSFTIFYYSFIEKCSNDEHFFQNQINTPLMNSWQGFAFERVCLLHINQIKEALGISGVYTECNSWYCKKNEDEGINGSQIDLLIVRKDQVINLCEMKFSNTEFLVTNKVIESINNKISDLKLVTKTKYAIYPTLITTLGLKENPNSLMIQKTITLKELFK